MMNRVVALVAVLLLSACEQDPRDPKARWTDSAAPASAPVMMRWYTREQVAAGAALYAKHCAGCHKANAEGTSDWKTRDANGKLPPPPLNGTAHAWHHSRDALRTVLKLGGAPIGGSMPGFADKLSAEEIDAILAWVQSHWPDRIYAIWHERDMAAASGMQAKQ